MTPSLRRWLLLFQATTGLYVGAGARAAPEPHPDSTREALSRAHRCVMSDGFLLLYLLTLLVSTVLMGMLAVHGYGLGARGRVVSALFGTFCLSYAVYLVFFFGGGSYRISLWAFIGPIYAVVRIVRHRRAVREQERAMANRLWGPAGVPAFLQPGYQHPQQPFPQPGFAPEPYFGPPGHAQPPAAQQAYVAPTFTPDSYPSPSFAPQGFPPAEQSSAAQGFVPVQQSFVPQGLAPAQPSFVPQGFPPAEPTFGGQGFPPAVAHAEHAAYGQAAFGVGTSGATAPASPPPPPAHPPAAPGQGWAHHG